MGSLYKRNGSKFWWLKYYQHGRAVRESSGTTKETVAKRMLRVREGDVERGIPINPRMDRITFEEAAQDLIHDYEANRRKSLPVKVSNAETITRLPSSARARSAPSAMER